MSDSDSGKTPALVAVEPQPIDNDNDNGIDIDNDIDHGINNHPKHPGPESSSRPRSGSLEDATPEPIVNNHNGDLITTAELHRLKRGLAERHLSMLGIAGAIGTGLFLSLGGAIQTGGPLGALLGYIVVGGIVCAVQFALGEVTALLPVRPSPRDLLPRYPGPVSNDERH